MADEVEVVHIAHLLIRLEQFQINASFAEQVPNLFFFLLGRPLTNEVIQRSIFATDIFLRVVHDALLPQQLAVCIIDRYRLVNDLHVAAVFIHNRLMFGGRGVSGCACFIFIRQGLSAVGRLFAWREAFVDLEGTIPFGIGKQAGHVAKVHYDKMCLSFIFPQTGAAANDLFELGHGADHLVQYDQLGHFAIRAGR